MSHSEAGGLGHEEYSGGTPWIKKSSVLAELRTLCRDLQSSVAAMIARRILFGDIAPESTITVDVEDGELVCL